MQGLYDHSPQLAGVLDFMELGGGVLALIALLTLVMWCLIFERLFYLGHSHRHSMQAARSQWQARPEHHSWYARQIRTQLVCMVSQRLEHNLALIRSCIALCPLLGLLGTVTGMIEVFQVMAVSGSGNPGSLAAGVSRATIPTMAGMVAALSGLGVSVWLQRRLDRERARLVEQLGMAGAGQH